MHHRFRTPLACACRRFPFLVLAVAGLLGGLSAPAAADRGPHILFIIADDSSRHWGEAYHCDWVKTPNIDRLAREGLVFDNAYVATSKCAPCRAAILTGRNPWQNEDAANHQNFFPARFAAFGDALKKAGVHTGSAGKVWGPGKALDANGNSRDFGLPPSKVKGKAPGSALAECLAARPADTPFFFWYGSNDPHRGYEAGSGIAAGKKITDIDHVPAYWPDNEIVRSDMLDYAIEVERFDSQVGDLLAALEGAGDDVAGNTLVIVTSDHGMPFPRVKGHTYDDAHRVPLVMRWPDGITNPGRRVTELVSFIDFAPTFLDLAGIDPAASGMAPITGRPFTDLLRDEPQTARPFLLIGRERNDVYARPGSPYGLGYPARGIRSGDFLFVRNFAPDRWPCGDPDLDLKDTDGSPTKSLLVELGSENPYWQHAFGKRPAEQLFNVAADPDCVKNLVADPALAKLRDELRETLMTELEKQADPRALGKGDVFDQYPSVKPVPPGWETGLPEPEKKPLKKSAREKK